MAGGDVDPTLARVAALEARIEQLEAERAPASRDESTASHDGPVSRRRLLGMAGAAAAGAVGATVLAASPAGATDPNDVVLNVDNQVATATTGISLNGGGRRSTR